ncbi:CGNR zinc finger domain-containing protein [Paraburkholderia sp. SARCC-3016]|jgi:predicted RNA-binding Zn ribbon-like protein|uniref:CGNR zinc finger domain-containing protein n=1 Tax=Paraburkholderia sp. SARCC-3016 TaxID=3058611 RepID=UPI0028093680|nr:CGNR zinc finger domain-containing protein [Paraburkholderia sp. SARCC-3016]MDQ7980581.1 CGNR zinc finger domain-containing protein [Paraburkholderia sp. SARCC-3016]
MASPLASVRAQDAVLEFLNTVVPRNGQLLDLFQSDSDVLAWLERAGLLDMIEMRGDGLYCDLALEARQLREDVRQLVLQKKLGQCVDAELLNRVLSAGSYQMELAEDGEGNLNALYRFPAQTAMQVLVPVAIAAAELLARGDFLLIRQCESPDCPLWFYDRTKSHRRRWCNMTICGNRQKAARFRTRLLCGGLVEQ